MLYVPYIYTYIHTYIHTALLHSMHKYFIHLVIDEERKSPPGEPEPVPRPILTMELPETAVTAYQNEEVRIKEQK